MTRGWLLRLMAAAVLLLFVPGGYAAMIYFSDDPGKAGWITHLGIVAEGRIGDTVTGGGSNRTFEIGTGLNTWESSAFDSANYLWPNALPSPLVFAFDGREASFSIGSAEVQWNDFSLAPFGTDPEIDFDGLAIRARTPDNTGILFSDLDLDGESLGNFFHSPMPISRYLLVDAGYDLSTGFTLQGNVTLFWNSSVEPRNSELAFQISGADAPLTDSEQLTRREKMVPIASTMALILPALAGLVGWRWRRSGAPSSRGELGN